MSSNHNSHHSHTKLYVFIFTILLFLTGLTVFTGTNHDIHTSLGSWAIYVAMLIATIKASLVAWYFMHLNEDSNFNRLVFTMSLLFLFIFVALTLSDIWTRPTGLAYAKVTPINEPESAVLSKMNDWRKSSPEAIEKGKKLFATNCAACHGASGMGDGPGGASLNPKPRNFTHEDGWKNGREPSSIFKTLKEGLGMMPSFSATPAEDRWALVHYVRTLAPNAPEDTTATLAAIGLGEGGAAKAQDPNSGIEIPVSFAIERMIQEAK